MANEDLIHHNVQRQSEWIQADVPRVNVDAADPLNYDNLEVSLLMSLQGRAMTATDRARSEPPQRNDVGVLPVGYA